MIVARIFGLIYACMIAAALGFGDYNAATVMTPVSIILIAIIMMREDAVG